MYTCIDCFCGAGGLSLGLKRAGYDVIYSFDNEAHCIETQKRNRKYFNHTATLANAKDLIGGVLLKRLGMKRGELFLLAGGPPCQGFSVQRIGKDHDPRNELVFTFIKLVEEFEPKYFLMENVPGITGKRGKILLQNALEKANTLGYTIHKKTLDAQFFSVPQRRKRVFIIGEKNAETGSSFKFPTPSGKRITVRETIGSLPEPPLNGMDHAEIKNHRRDKLSKINIERLRALLPGQGRDQLPKKLLANCHKQNSNIIGHRNVYGRMNWDDVSPTITARFDSFTRGQFGHPEQLRSISLREGALLQTFPKGFVFYGTKVEIARQIGNAVPPRLAEAVGREIIKSYKMRPR